MWADVICIWDGLAGNLSRTLQFQIWELTFESSATRKTRLCARVCGYLESKLPLNFEQPYPPKTSHSCLQKMLLFYGFASQKSIRELRCSKAATALASALFCKRWSWKVFRGDGLGCWIMENLSGWWNAKLFTYPYLRKSSSDSMKNLQVDLQETFGKLGGGSSIFMVLSSRLAALQDVVMSQCLCLPTLI